jgi:hypothetical protein
MEHLVEQLVARGGGKLVEHVTGGVGERGAKSQHTLELLVWVEHDHRPGRHAGTRFPRNGFGSSSNGIFFT